MEIAGFPRTHRLSPNRAGHALALACACAARATQSITGAFEAPAGNNDVHRPLNTAASRRMLAVMIEFAQRNSNLPRKIN